MNMNVPNAASSTITVSALAISCNPVKPGIARIVIPVVMLQSGIVKHVVNAAMASVSRVMGAVQLISKLGHLSSYVLHLFA